MSSLKKQMLSFQTTSGHNDNIGFKKVVKLNPYIAAALVNHKCSRIDNDSNIVGQ